MSRYMGGDIWLPVSGTWQQVRQDDLQRLADQGKHEEVQSILDYINAYLDNKLSFFLPHGDGAAFLSDYESDVCLLTAPNQSGKSLNGAIWTLLRILPTDPEWPVFTQHGVKHPGKWHGPKTYVVTSYKSDTAAELWQHYLDYAPRHELGQYASDWGRRKGERGKPMTMNFGDGGTKTFTFACGSKIKFLFESQDQASFEGFRADGLHSDEQISKPKFIGLLRAMQTRGDNTQICMTLTGHAVKGRPDTGAAGWIKRQLFDGNDTMGLKVGRYKITIEQVPDCILTPKKKAALYERWYYGPLRTGDHQALNEGEARLFGGWEAGGGLVLSNFRENIHLIPRYDREHDVVRDATKYRGIDHGTRRPTGMLCGEVFPWGDLVLYREYYKPGGTVSGNTKEMIELCGNIRVKVGDQYRDDIEASTPLFEEEYLSERFEDTVLDGRSFNTPSSEHRCNIGELYQAAGLSVRPATTEHNNSTVPRILELLEPDPKRPHIMWHLWKAGIIGEDVYQKWLSARDGNHLGGAKLYIVEDMVKWRMEATAWAYQDEEKDKIKAEDDHLMAAMKYMVSIPPTYQGDYWRNRHGRRGAHGVRSNHPDTPEGDEFAVSGGERMYKYCAE
jgi:hypothetical protein